jgi:hypothetical protein
MQDPEEDPPFGDELVERPPERVPTAPAPAHRHRHRAADRSLHLRPLADGFLDPLHPNQGFVVLPAVTEEQTKKKTFRFTTLLKTHCLNNPGRKENS